MKIGKGMLAACALVLAASLTYTSAFTQDAAGEKKEQAKPVENAAPKPAETTASRPAETTASKLDENAKPKRTSGPRAAKVDRADGKLISPYSLAERTALNKLDCKPNSLQKNGVGMHGRYRTYGEWDPELKSIEGRKQFDACVKRGLDPTPGFAFGQRMMISANGNFFGRTKDDCLKCHSKY